MKKVLNQIELLPIPLKIVLSFLAVIFAGSLLLSLSISQIPGSEATYFDHLFTTVSMVCVTGLYTQSVASTYSIIGQIFCMVLMKLGGLGLLTIVSAVYFSLGRSVSIRNEVTLQQALNRDQLGDFKSFILSIVKFSTLFELIGAFLLMSHFIPLLGVAKGAFNSLFLAVSGFNNAGFDNMGTSSLIDFSGVPIINLVIPLLIIVGGIGFTVWFDIGNTLKEADKTLSIQNIKIIYRRLSLHTRLVLNWTMMLLLIGAVSFLIFEWNNPQSIGQMNVFDKLQAAFFQSVTMRTAGFATVSYDTVHIVTLIMFCSLMFIGGSPGGTAGGAKTSTVALVFKGLKTEITGEEDISYQKRSLNQSLVRKAAIIVVLFILLNLIGVSLLTIFDGHIPLEYLIFESFSALGTVGVSANITPDLSRMSQLVLMLEMFLGRLGPITVFTALRLQKRSKKKYKYAEGKVLIG